MTEIVFIGLGLHDELGISLRGLEEIKSAKQVFIELYTNLLPHFSVSRLEEIIGKKTRQVSRKELEDNDGEAVLKAAEQGKVALLVPGDPLIATTHIALRIEAQKRGVDTRVVHGSSAITAVIGLSGLHNYKFGKSVTIPFPDQTSSRTSYDVIAQNRKLGLHTLCLLDIDVEQNRCLNVHDALRTLTQIERKRKKKAATVGTLVVGVARAGSKNPNVKAGTVKELMTHDFGGPPYSLIFPGELHFMEAESLIRFASAPKELLEAKQ